MALGLQSSFSSIARFGLSSNRTMSTMHCKLELRDKSSSVEFGFKAVIDRRTDTSLLGAEYSNFKFPFLKADLSRGTKIR
jgi:hypothetical protein